VQLTLHNDISFIWLSLNVCVYSHITEDTAWTFRSLFIPEVTNMYICIYVSMLYIQILVCKQRKVRVHVLFCYLWRVSLKASRSFTATWCSPMWFQSMIVLAKNEILFLSLLVQIVLKHLELFVLLFWTGSTTIKSCNVMVVVIRL
jgi:hypothetical protein